MFSGVSRSDQKKETGQARLYSIPVRLRSATAFAAGVASRAGLRGLAADELVEVALLPASGLILAKQCEAVLVEGLEPIVPADVLQ